MPNSAKKTKDNGGGGNKTGTSLVDSTDSFTAGLLQLPDSSKRHQHQNQNSNTKPSSSPSASENEFGGGTKQLLPMGKLSSRVMFSSESVAIEPNLLEEGGNGSSSDMMDVSDEDDREGWDNKMQFFMGVISYAVGFGNVWRFPFLLQKNGGGAFLIPYIIMMIVEGIPLFLIELGIGQRLRTGPVGVWNAIHPYLGGVGVSATLVSYLVSLYYDVILTWVVYYLFKSIRIDLPWSSCPTLANGSNVTECIRSTSPTNYFWNRVAIDTSNSIGEFGGFTWHMTICLVLSWLLIFCCVMKGIKSSGKVMYVTATFPYFVLTAFMFRSILLPGATDGLQYMITPDLSRLWEPDVWLEAATQIFYSMGLGFGGLIAFASYNPIKNNCKKDVIKMSLANLLTSLYTAFVIFCVLGYMGRKNFDRCIQKDMALILNVSPGLYANMEEINGNITVDEFTSYMRFDFRDSKFADIIHHPEYRKCELGEIISEAAEGTGLAFVVFTEAITQFPFPPFWAILFFMMLLMLGLGSMFGMLEGVITSLNDAKMITLSKPVLAAILCTSACLIGLVFTTQAGQYWVSLFDHFAGTYALLCVAFFEVVAVIYVYGCDNFVRDLQFMTDEPVGNYWIITWKFISPVIMLLIFVLSMFKSFSKVPGYSSYDSETTHQHMVPYPNWALFIAFGLVVLAMAPLPFIWFVRKFKIWRAEADIPAASKCLGSTQSTTYMLRSEMSFNRILESTAIDRNGHIGGGSAPTSVKHHRHQNNNNNDYFNYHLYNNHNTWHSGNAPPRGYLRNQQQKKGSDTDLPSATATKAVNGIDGINVGHHKKSNGGTGGSNKKSHAVTTTAAATPTPMASGTKTQADEGSSKRSVGGGTEPSGTSPGLTPRSNTADANSSWARNRHRSIEK